MVLLSISALAFILILVISNSIGNYIINKFLKIDLVIPELVGFSTWMGILFIFGYILILLDVKTVIFFNFFLVVSIMLLLLTIKSFKWRYSKLESIFILSFVLFFAILSLKYRLGEQLGDNTYLMNMVSMNTIRSNLNYSDYSNGIYYGFQAEGPHKAYLTWYHFFAFITYFIQKTTSSLGFSYVPSSIYYVWIANLLFYIFSSLILLRIPKYFDTKHNNLTYIIVLILGLYWGSIYYNLVLPHYGTNFLSIFIINTWMLLYCFRNQNLMGVLVVVFSVFATASTGVAGLISSGYIVFSFIGFEILNKNENIFKWALILLLPFVLWMYILKAGLPVESLFISLLTLFVVLFFLHLIKPLKHFAFRYFRFILFFTLLIIFTISLIYVNFDIVKLYSFFEVKSNFDRVQDYFNSSNLNETFRNFAYYIAIFGLFVNDKIKKIKYWIIFIVLFFINPVVYPLLYSLILWEYNRAFISIFNVFFIGIGIVALIDYLYNTFGQKINFVVFFWILLLIPITYSQLTSYFNPVYIPSQDYNPIMKLDYDEIEVLDKLHQIVSIENYENARVISQIYATTMYEPSIYQILFNFSNRRGFDSTQEFDKIDPLYRIFYTPAFPGDDGPRLTAPVEMTCQLLIDYRVDFIIYNKSLSVYDKSIGNWLPIYWYAKDCAEIVIENDTYIMYRFYWK